MCTIGLLLVISIGGVRIRETAWGAEPVVPAEHRPIEIGHCRLKLIHEVVLASDRAGILDFVEDREGAPVVKGQQVARIKDDAAQASLAIVAKEAENDVEIRFSRKSSEVAEAEFLKSREANLSVPGVIPEFEVRRLKLAFERSILEIEQAEYRKAINEMKLNEARAQLKTFRVEAPFDGLVTRIHKQQGEAVRQGDPIVEIADTRHVRVEGYVNLRDSWQVQPGAAVAVQLDIPDVELEVEDLVFKGQVVYVDVKVQPVTGGVRVYAEVVNRGNILRAGLTARMTIAPLRQRTTPAAPVQARSIR